MADEDQRDARQADVPGKDRRAAEREEGSHDSRHEQLDSRIRSQGLRFLVASGSPRRADARTRTGDPFITSEVLYQLSYVGAALSLAVTQARAGRPRETRPHRSQ